MSSTHYKTLVRKLKTRTADPVDPFLGQEYYDTGNDKYLRYNGTSFIGYEFSSTTTISTSTTTTTTSTSITTTSTSTTTTTTSTSTSTTTSTSTSTSTTTTL